MSNSNYPVREGSSLHYSLLWTDSSAKTRFIDRLALIKALTTTLDDVQETQVAQKKIHWWHEELQRLFDGNARHPATQLNQTELQGEALAQTACLEIISVASTQRFTAAETIAAGESELIRSFKARLALLAHALSGSKSDLDTGTHLDVVARAFGLHDQLIRLPGLIHRGQPVFSDELYQQFRTRPHELAAHIRVAESAKHPGQQTGAKANHSQTALNNIPIVIEKSAKEIPARQQLLAYAIGQCHTALSLATNDAACAKRYRQRSTLPLWRLLILRKHQLDLWQKQQPDLLRERTTLTPLVKLFRAWQHRR